MTAFLFGLGMANLVLLLILYHSHRTYVGRLYDEIFVLQKSLIVVLDQMNEIDK